MKAAKSQQATGGYDAATGTSGPGYNRQPNSLAKNQFTGHSNDGRTVNFGRGSTVGNDGTCGHAGMPHVGAKPHTAKTPSLPAQGSVRDSINRGAQVRTPGGTVAMPKTGQDRFDMGRGPTKGNSQ